MLDIFVCPDELAKRYKIVNGCFSLRDKKRFFSSQELDQTSAVLNLIDCKTNAQGKLFANKELDEYKLREGHFKSCACRRCLMSHIGHLMADSADQEEEIMDVSGELHQHEQWEPEKIHYDYYSGEPLDEDLYQKGRDDELLAMQDYGVYVEIPIREAVGGKHFRGFPIAHMKGDRVRWRFVATEVSTEFREDNHQGTPPLMIVRATISRAGSCPTWRPHENDSFLGCHESVLQC